MTTNTLRYPRRSSTRAVLVLVGFLTACAATPNPSSVEPPPQFAGNEYVGVVVPVMQLMKLLSLFYAENGRIPEDSDTLAAFAVKVHDPIAWERFTRYEVTDTDQGRVIHLSIRSPSPHGDSGDLSTSWKLVINQPTDGTKTLGFSIYPVSGLCLNAEITPSQRDQSQVESFIDRLTAYWSREPLSSSTEFCPIPSASNIDSAGDRVKQKLMERLHK